MKQATQNLRHETVLLDQSVDGLSLSAGDTAIDATVGTGGHAEKISRVIGKKGTLLVVDIDGRSIARSRERLEGALAKIIFLQGNFRNLKTLANEAGIDHAEGGAGE